jgi:hypothetical protein
VRIAVQGVPQRSESDAGAADDDQKRAPAESGGNPEQHRAQEGEAEVLANRVDARRRSAFGLRKPGPQDAAVGWERRCFGDAQAHAARDQRREARGQALQQRERGPDRHGQKVRDSHADAVQQDAAWNLRGGIGPRESGKHHAHRDCAEAEVAAQQRSGDADDRAVQIVDQRPDGQQREDCKACVRAPGRGQRCVGGSL